LLSHAATALADDSARSQSDLEKVALKASVEHIGYIVDENRTFDHYFGRFPGADGETKGRISTGQTVELRPAPDRTPHDIDHSYQAAVTAINNGAMDRFDLIAGGNVNGELLAYTQYREKDLPNYFRYARHFCAGRPYVLIPDRPQFSKPPLHGRRPVGWCNQQPDQCPRRVGCDAEEDSSVQIMDQQGHITRIFPCFDFLTLADLLETAGHSWK
jgi:Phosphoesterase family